MRRVVVLLLIALLPTGHALGLMPEYQIQDLGKIGGVAFRAWGMNNSDAIVGDVQLPMYSGYMLSSAGQASQLVGIDGRSSHARDVNNGGTAVGDTVTDNGRWHACIWHPDGTLTDIDFTDGSWALSLNDNGQVAGRIETNGESHAYRWNTSGVGMDLGELSGYAFSHAWGINGLGDVAGSVVFGAGSHACIWDSQGALRLLELPAGYFTSEARSLNDLGQAAGYVRTQWQDYPCFWDADGTATVLPAVYGGNAYAISRSGVVVGGMVDGTGETAFAWDSTNGLISLPSNEGVTWNRAYAMNDNGCIVGYSGDSGALWKPIPEPSSLLTLGSGILGLVGMIRKRR